MTKSYRLRVPSLGALSYATTLFAWIVRSWSKESKNIKKSGYSRLDYSRAGYQPDSAINAPSPAHLLCTMASHSTKLSAWIVLSCNKK